MNKVKQAVHDVDGNKATIDSFTQDLQSDQTTSFEATYMTTGGAPATVVYAVEPAERRAGVPRDQTGANASNVQLIVNSSGEYSCHQSGPAGAWSCQKLSGANAADQKQIFDIYTRRTGSRSSRAPRWWPGWPGTR